MDLVDDQVVQLEHVDLPDHDTLLEGVAGASVVETGLAVDVDEVVGAVGAIGVSHLAAGAGLVVAGSHIPAGSGDELAQIGLRLVDGLALDLAQRLHDLGGDFDSGRLGNLDQAGALKKVDHPLLGHAVEGRGGDGDAENLRGVSGVGLEDLPDVHSGRHTKWIKNDIKRTAIWKEWHIFYRKYTGNYTLVTMTSGHLITNRNLSLLGNVNTNRLVNSWR